MTCQQERTAWEAADTELTTAQVQRTQANDDLQAASDEQAVAEQNLVLSQGATAQASADLQAAEQAVTSSATAASDAYQDYLACVIGDPDAPEEEQNAARAALHVLRGLRV